MKYLILLLIASLYGCAGYYEADPLFKQQSNLLVDNTDEIIVNADELKKRVDKVNDSTVLRNQLIEELLTISDRSCAKHHSHIISNLNTWNVSTGTLSTLLSSIGAVTGGESAKAALSAGAAFTNSTRSLVNEEVYAKALGTTIVRATVSARQKKMADIRKGMLTENIKEYSTQQGLRDVYNYQNRCSFYYGLLEITKALEERKPTKSEILNSISLLKTQLADDKENELQLNVTKIKEHIEALALDLEHAPQ